MKQWNQLPLKEARCSFYQMPWWPLLHCLSSWEASNHNQAAKSGGIGGKHFLLYVESILYFMWKRKVSITMMMGAVVTEFSKLTLSLCMNYLNEVLRRCITTPDTANIWEKSVCGENRCRSIIEGKLFVYTKISTISTNFCTNYIIFTSHSTTTCHSNPNFCGPNAL
jgi:hypothetical protein